MQSRPMIKFARTTLPTVIVRRRRRDAPQIGHNSAWKVAYADFVTAMMSFFLLLWLLSVTTTTQREAISSYFDPAAADAKNGAGGVMGGKSLLETGQQVSSDTATGPHPPFPGTPDTSRRHDNENDPGAGETPADSDARTRAVDNARYDAKLAAEREDLHFKEAEAALRQAIQSVPEMQVLARNLIVDETPEGLRIQLVDQDGASMFPSGSIEMYERTRKLLAIVSQSVESLPNKVSIRGHTDAAPYRSGADHYNNWDLSSERANATRRALEAAGLSPDRIGEVIGKADKDPLIPAKPLSAQNRRISIIMLRQAPPVAAPTSIAAPTR